MKAVEHFKPKSGFPDLSKEWTNLLLACSQCNGKKSNEFPVVYSDTDAHPCVLRYPTDVREGVAMMIDPSKAADTDPRDSIQFIVDDEVGDFCGIMERDHCVRGRKTIEVIGLDRDFYRKRRYQHYKLLRSYYDIFLDAIEAAKVSKRTQDVELAFARIEGSYVKSEEFSAFARDYFTKKKTAERFAEFMDGKYF